MLLALAVGSGETGRDLPGTSVLLLRDFMESGDRILRYRLPRPVIMHPPECPGDGARSAPSSLRRASLPPPRAREPTAQQSGKG